jgi:hypothetical protein
VIVGVQVAIQLRAWKLARNAYCSTRVLCNGSDLGSKRILGKTMDRQEKEKRGEGAHISNTSREESPLCC